MNIKQETKDFLYKNRDEAYKQFHSKFVPNIDPNSIVGVRVPILKIKAKQIAKENPIEFLENVDNEYNEERMLKILVISYMKSDIETYLKYTTKFLPEINSWGICDTCNNMKWIKKNREVMWDYIRPLIESEQEFIVRFAVIIMLSFFADEEYFYRITECIDKIEHRGYYVQMGVAWCISVLYVKMPDKTMEYLKNCRIDDFTYNKALQKIIESYRVSNEDKEIIRKMKRKGK